MPTFVQIFLICFYRVALDRAEVLLTMKREMVRLDNVWGVGGGLRPVKHLVKEVREYSLKKKKPDIINSIAPSCVDIKALSSMFWY